MTFRFAAVCVLAFGVQTPRAVSDADLLIVNARVYPAGGSKTFHEAVAVSGNRIVAVGARADLEHLRGAKTQLVDARGAAVLPGFNDIHTHMLSGGLAMDDVDLQGAQSLDDLQSRIRAFAVAHPEQPWIRGRGWGYGPFGDGLPLRAELDAVVADRPAVMRCYDGHSVWVNSKALAAAGITRDTPDPPNGTIVREKTGEPTGLIKESPAMALISKVEPKPTMADQRRALGAAFAEALKYGVTSVTDAAGSLADFEAYDRARKAGELQVRVHYSLLVTPGFTDADADRFDAFWKAHPDTPWLKSGLIKMFLDGVIETNTAFMLAPYANDLSTRGKPNYSVEEFDRIVQMLDRRGWQIMVHALGDGAVRMALDGFERAARANPAPARGRRHRLEHIETIDLADVPRFGKLGVIASMHPVGGFFVPTQNRPAAPAGGRPAAVGAWAGNLGPERAAHGGMWKSISEAGGKVVFGSDWPVATIDAFGRIVGIVNRPPRIGGTDQRLSLTTAVDDYTSQAAYASFDEQQKGTLASGMLADIVILATDVFSHPPATRADAAVMATIVDGKVVYRDQRF